MLNKIENIVNKSLAEMNATLPKPIPLNNNADIVLYGKEGMLDSLALVTLIISIEEKLEVEENVSVILANEKALSLKQSPFNTVASLVSYINECVGVSDAH